MVSTRLRIAAVAGVVIAGVAWWCWPANAIAPNGAAPPAAIGAAAAGAENGNSGAAPNTVTRQEAIATSDATNTPAPGTHGRRLRIVDENGKPLPGAEYFHGPRPSSSQTGLLECEAWRERWHPTDAWLARKCTRLIADADGYVISPTDVHHLYVARDRGRLAFWGWNFPDELQFAPERTCMVTVVDASGVAVPGAAIVLRARITGTSAEAILGVTDESGRCRIGHLENLRSRDWECEEGHHLGVRGLGLRTADMPLDAESPPDELTLTLPPIGTLAVELLDAQGTRLSSPMQIILLGHGEEMLLEYTRASGPIVFGHCAVGEPLQIGSAQGRSIAGPRSPGEHVLVQLSLPDLEPGGFVFTGRALTSDGQPLAASELDTTFDSGRLGASSMTGSDGRFVFVHPASDGRKLADCFAIVQREMRDGIGLVERRGTTVRLPEHLGPGHHDLGDVRMQDAVVMVRGRVRGAGPITDFNVKPDYYGEGIELRKPAEGRFEVWALPHRKRVWLDVWAQGYTVTQVASDLPGPDLDVVLCAAGKCHLIAILEPGLAERSDSLRAELVDGSGTRFSQHRSNRYSEWGCEAIVPPGTYRCEFFTLFSDQPIAVLNGIVIVQADDAGDPIRVDLRGLLRACRLSWVDRDGQPLDSDSAHVYAPAVVKVVDGTRVCDAAGGDGHGCTLLGTGEPIDVEVEANGFTGRYAGPFVDTAVFLRPRPYTSFRIPDLPPAPDGTEWTVRATASGGDAETRMRLRSSLRGRPNSFTFGDCDAHGRGRICLLPNSRYQIELLFSPGDKSTRRFTALEATSGEVTIGATPPGDLVFTFDPRQVQDALR